MKFSFEKRLENISKLKSETFDLVIVGGGITGAGIARDACSRGMKVALLEAGDFAIGTSSRSSKLIHGGVRYLENLEFKLVFEALSERALLFKLAPHLVHPLRFLIPIYKDSRVGYWKMLAGMWLYDLLALFETPQLHEGLNPAEVRQRVKNIEGRGLVGALEYSDAYTDDDRLVIETLRDADRLGGCLTNYTKVVGASYQEGQIEELSVLDRRTGETFKVKGRQFVSGVGPWTDIFGKNIDKQWKERLRPTKGVHLVFSKKTIPVEKAVVMAVEKRIIFVIPRHEMVIVGTTDTDFNGNPTNVSTDVEDVEYILQALNKYFPSLKVEAHQIISSYSGVRPLVNDGSDTEGKTSREHSIFHHGTNLTFVAGGKYTTYRKISEEAVDAVLEKFDFETKMAFGPSNTKRPLNPKVSASLYQRAQSDVPQLSQRYKINELVVSRLVNRHGEEAEYLLSVIVEKYAGFSPNEALWMAEADFAINHTMCMGLVDFYWRRSPLFLATKNHGVSYIDAISKVFAKYFNWSEEQIKFEQNELMQQMQAELSWKGKIKDLSQGEDHPERSLED